MAQRAIPTVLEKQGRRNVMYRAADGASYTGYITGRVSATVANLVIWRGAKRATVASVPVATTKKGTNVFWFITGH